MGEAKVSQHGDGAQRLRRLTPTYVEEFHAKYVERLLAAVTARDPARNIALAGAYGTGKSSILKGLKRALRVGRNKTARDSVIEISLSNLNQPEAKLVADSGESSLSAVLQKEIVKRLLYNEKPSKLPLSRFKRIIRFDLLGAVEAAGAILVSLLALALLAFGPGNCLDWLLSKTDRPMLMVFAGALAFLLLALLVQRTLHGNGVQELTVGSASVKLNDSSATYFDQYLDEVIYFFEQTRMRFVIFEDLDRFNDQDIFRSLRDLNQLLNSARTVRQPVVFVYAIRDSLFECRVQRVNPEFVDAQAGEVATADKVVGGQCATNSRPHGYGVDSPASDRAKFFDLIIPVVPFISHDVASDLLLKELEPIKGPDRPSVELMELAGRYFTDMRVIHSVANEFVVYTEELLHQTKVLGLTPNGQFAMVLYKHVNLADFERIRIGTSKLDRLVDMVRSVTSAQLTAIDEEIADIDGGSIAERQLDELAHRAGPRLQALLTILEAGRGRGTPKSVTLGPGGRSYGWQSLLGKDFWRDVGVQPGSLRLNSNGADYDFPMQLVAPILETDSGVTPWKERNAEVNVERLQQLRRMRNRLATATFQQRVTDASLTPLVGPEGQINIPLKAQEILGEGLALELVRAGHIDNNFTLYSAAYYGVSVSASARSFILQCVDRYQSDPYFRLSREDVDGLIKHSGLDFLRNVSVLNISIFEHMLEDPRFQVTLDMICDGVLDRDYSFLGAFFAGSELADRLVAKLTPRLFSVLDLIATNERLGDAEKARLLDVALAHLEGEWDYDVNETTRAFLADHINELRMIGELLPEEAAQSLARLLGRNGIAVASLERVYPQTRPYIVERVAFVINLENLLTISKDDGHVGIDTISAQSEPAARRMVEEAEAYIQVLESDSQRRLFSIDDPGQTTKVLELAKDLPSSLLDALLALANPAAIVEELLEAPAEAWRSLVRTNRLVPSAVNLVEYLAQEDHDAYHKDVATWLNSVAALLAADNLTADQRISLAEWLISDGTIEVDAKLRLLESLNLADAEALNLENLVIGNGTLLAGLISSNYVEDTVSTFRHVSTLPWEERERAVAASSNVADFLPAVVLNADELHMLVDSVVIRSDVRLASLDHLAQFDGDAMINSEVATSMAQLAASVAKEVSDDDLIILSVAGAPSHLIAKLLGQHLDNRSVAGITSVLKGLDEEYAKLASADGKRPCVDADPDVERLLGRLMKVGLVSRFEVDRRRPGKLRAFMRRKAR